MEFAKYEGLGNDFVLVNVDEAGRTAIAQEAPALCDRFRGIGANGVLLIGTGEQPRMEVINSDGSRAEMCGNGLRCVAMHAYRTGLVTSTRFTVDTDAGPHACEVLPDGRVRVAMRAASLAPQQVPVRSDDPMVDTRWVISGHAVHLTCVSMGNPHAVTFDALGDERLALGPQIGADKRFPEGVNVGFAQLVGPREVELHVFERGAGWTEACGTGACAAVVAAVATGRMPADEEVQVRLPGGGLTIRAPQVDSGEAVWMTGPAEHVFDGVWRR